MFLSLFLRDSSNLLCGCSSYLSDVQWLQPSIGRLVPGLPSSLQPQGSQQFLTVANIWITPEAMKLKDAYSLEGKL